MSNLWLEANLGRGALFAALAISGVCEKKRIREHYDFRRRFVVFIAMY
jgi:hypothetical protein